ncbi:hypothetical protein CAL7716_046880 [Calothrix sp. PCC 7716]|nr:hypothetical protein CAL7716_046880 [Calothrix sp. PCC 7716]
MRLQHEIEVLSTVIKDKTYGMEGEFLIETSIEIVFKDRERKNFYFDNIFFPKLSPCGSFFQGSYNLQKETYNDWVSINNQRCLLTSLVENHQLTLISEAEYNQCNVNKNYPYRSFNRLTRPGFSPNFSQAIIQIYVYSPGAHDFGSILYLERVSQQWHIKSSYGLYNQ